MNNALIWLAIILFALMKIVGGEKGTRSFMALFFNFSIMLVTIILMTDQAINPILITIIACILISCINLFYINQFNFKSITAFASTIITLVLLMAVFFFLVGPSKIQGFGIEEIEELSAFSFLVGIDFGKIAISTIIMGAIGAITDTAISISSAMNEIRFHNPHLSPLELFQSGMSVGKDILGTTTNTLFFAFIGGYLALIIWFEDLDYSFGEIVNSKVFSSEVISIFCIGAGAILIIPITAWLTAYSLSKYEEKNRSSKVGTEESSNDH